mgnify:CR=1 FL=1|jgi:hypothetical protein
MVCAGTQPAESEDLSAGNNSGVTPHDFVTKGRTWQPPISVRP